MRSEGLDRVAQTVSSELVKPTEVKCGGRFGEVRLGRVGARAVNLLCVVVADVEGCNRSGLLQVGRLVCLGSAGRTEQRFQNLGVGV